MKFLKQLNQKLLISNFLFEIRFKPNPIVLDNRGKWASIISNDLDYPVWQITENKIDFINSSKNEEAFLAYKNAGYKIINEVNNERYKKRSIELIDLIFSKEILGTEFQVERIGVRSIFCYRYQGEFNKLKDLFECNFVGLTKNAKDIFKASITDVSAVFDFSDEYGSFHIISGPMREKQIKEFLPKAETLPEIGLYFDIDYWRKPNKILSKDEISEAFNILVDAGSMRFEQVLKILGV